MARNFDRIQFASLRVKLDPVFNALHDELSVAYYQFWKLGLPQLWIAYNVEATPAASLLFFNRLHGALFNFYTLAFHEVNQIDIDGGIPREQYDRLPLDLDESIDDIIERPTDKARRTIAVSGVNLAPLRARIRSDIRDGLGHNITLT